MTISKGLAAIAAGVTCVMASSAYAAPVIVENGDANALADVLIGTGINRVGDATLTIADSAQAGTFTGGPTPVLSHSGFPVFFGGLHEENPVHFGPVGRSFEEGNVEKDPDPAVRKRTIAIEPHPRQFFKCNIDPFPNCGVDDRFEELEGFRVSKDDFGQGLAVDFPFG